MNWLLATTYGCTYVHMNVRLSTVLADHMLKYIRTYVCSCPYQSLSELSKSQKGGFLICTEVLDGVTLALIIATVLDLKGAQMQTPTCNGEFRECMYASSKTTARHLNTDESRHTATSWRTTIQTQWMSLLQGLCSPYYKHLSGHKCPNH